MEPWRRVWRDGIVPLLSIRSLEALRQALADDDPRLVQGAIVLPAEPMGHLDPAQAACGLGYCGWQGEDLETVGQVQEFFLLLVGGVERRLCEPGGSRHFLNWFDETPRPEILASLLPEVELALAGKSEAAS